MSVTGSSGSLPQAQDPKSIPNQAEIEAVLSNLLADANAVPGVAKFETKPAVKTTEFWIHNALLVLLWVAHIVQSSSLTLGKTALFSSAVSGLYMLSRGLAKAGSPSQN